MGNGARLKGICWPCQDLPVIYMELAPQCATLARAYECFVHQLENSLLPKSGQNYLFM